MPKLPNAWLLCSNGRLEPDTKIGTRSKMLGDGGDRLAFLIESALRRSGNPNSQNGRLQRSSAMNAVTIEGSGHTIQIRRQAHGRSRSLELNDRKRPSLGVEKAKVTSTSASQAPRLWPGLAAFTVHRIFQDRHGHLDKSQAADIMLTQRLPDVSDHERLDPEIG